jgi:hypothetical protein
MVFTLLTHDRCVAVGVCRSLIWQVRKETEAAKHAKAKLSAENAALKEVPADDRTLPSLVPPLFLAHHPWSLITPLLSCARHP